MQYVTFFRGGTLVSLNPGRVEQADLVVADGRIVKKGGRLAPPPGAEIVDVRGRIILAGLVDAHVELPGAYASVLPHVDAAALENAQTDESVVCAVFSAALEAVRAGVTTLVVRNISPSCAEGSLIRVRDVLATLGIRFAASYGVSDLALAPGGADGLVEARMAAAFGAAPRMRYLLGAAPLGRVSDALLASLADLSRKSQSAPHVSVGFDGATPESAHAELERLFAAGFSWTGGVVVCGPAVSSEDMTLVRGHGATPVVLPHSASGAGRVFQPGNALGTGSGRPDLFEALRTTVAVAEAAGRGPTADEATALLGGGQALAAKLFGMPFGTLDPGAPADLVVLDYRPSSPLTDETASRHVLHGMSAAHVQHVLVDGRVVLRDRAFHRLETGRLARQLQRGGLDLVMRATAAAFPGADRERDEDLVQELREDRSSVGPVRSTAETPVEFEVLPAEDAAEEPWRIRGGDRGSDSDALSRVLPPLRALRHPPAEPLIVPEPVIAAPLAAVPAPKPGGRGRRGAAAPAERAERAERGDRPERAERGERAERPERSERPERGEPTAEIASPPPIATKPEPIAEPVAPPKPAPPTPPAPPADPFGVGID